MNYNEKDILISDFCDYFDINKDLVIKGIEWESNNTQHEESRSVPRFWKWMYGHRIGSTDEYRYFYSICPFYLFDLANFANQFSFNKANAFKYLKGKCLDFGCGIGTVALEMLKYKKIEQIDAIDVSIVSTDFLKYRTKKHKLMINVLDPTDNVSYKRSTHNSLKEKYDFIYIRDVLEHAIDRIDIINKIIDHTSDDGVIVEASPISNYPDAIGKENISLFEYDIWNVLADRGFEIIEKEWTGGFSEGFTNVWKRK